MASSSSSFNATFLQHWDLLLAKIDRDSKACNVDSHALDLATVVAVARYDATVVLDGRALDAVAASSQVVRDSLSKGQIIYGVNTGFGGSADTRTDAVEDLQRELMRGCHYGILAQPESNRKQAPAQAEGSIAKLGQKALPLDDPFSATSMPESWVRASMLVRLNSLIGGASGVQVGTVTTLAELLQHDIVPRIPLRGSISASGDLSPLSYIGGVMQGKPTLTVHFGDRTSADRRIVRADVALKQAKIAPIKLGAKEGLAIINGTAVSAGVAALAMHEAHCLAALSQLLTAMSVEALVGTDESFDPFFAKVRPHPGQQESAHNIFTFLADSKLVNRTAGTEEASLRQDRYSIRTAAQWIGPVLEDLLLAHNQVTIELNSVTDNPLLDTATSRMLHGGNFQAKSVTSAMEKVRPAMQTIGRMLFSQCTELINPVMNRGLPPNLVADEPSGNFIWKGTDIMAAALTSELGFLANPVGTHVQTAEMGNQALNSLALISARYTHDAITCLTQLSAAHLVALCQALDLRAMHLRFLETLRPTFLDLTHSAFAKCFRPQQDADALGSNFWNAFLKRLETNSSADAAPRFRSTVESLQPAILLATVPDAATLEALGGWTERCAAAALSAFELTRDHYSAHPDATPFLGSASKRMYTFVRKRLEVPFVRKTTITTPDVEYPGFDFGDQQATDCEVPTVGGLLTRVYDSMRDGRCYEVVMECFKAVDRELIHTNAR